MTRHACTASAVLLFATLAATAASAQNVTIAHVRIIGPDASVVERGSIVVRDGKMVSASAGRPATTSGQTIDAKGMSAMPGFIDAHRHFNTAPNEKAQMQAQLEGQINGPRIIPSGQIRLNQRTPDSASASVTKPASCRSNTASYLQMGNQLGSLEAGRIADIVLLDGDPLEGYWNCAK